MNRQFTRRRRDKGTQVTKRPAHTQGTKYGEKRVGLLRLLINSDLQQGTFLTKQNLLKNIYDRRAKHQQQLPPFIYQCLKKVQQLQPTQENIDIQSYNNAYATLLTSSNIFYQMEKNTWIITQLISPKALRFVFYKQCQREFRAPQTFSLKEFPSKIQDFQLFKGTPPIAILNFGLRLVGLTVSIIKEQQKSVFNYQLSSKVQKYLVQKDSVFVLLKNGSIVFGKMGDELDFLDDSKAKFGQLKLCGIDVLVVTRSYVVKIITTTGNPKKIIRAGVQLSNVIPIYISTNMYVLMAEQQGKTCLLNCYKFGKNNYLQACPEGLDKIQQTLYIGKWILLRTQAQKIYTFPLIKDTPVRIFEIYNGISPGMLKILHKKLVQT